MIAVTSIVPPDLGAPDPLDPRLSELKLSDTRPG